LGACVVSRREQFQYIEVGDRFGEIALCPNAAVSGNDPLLDLGMGIPPSVPNGRCGKTRKGPGLHSVPVPVPSRSCWLVSPVHLVATEDEDGFDRRTSLASPSSRDGVAIQMVMAVPC
jgi:hypothetical protein